MKFNYLFDTEFQKKSNDRKENGQLIFSRIERSVFEIFFCFFHWNSQIGTESRENL